MKRNLLTIISIALLAISCQQNDLLPTQDPGQGIRLIIPELSATRASWADIDGKGHWDEGDKVYIIIRYRDKDYQRLGDWHHLVALRTGGQWVFSGPVPTPPAGTAQISIDAEYAYEFDPANPANNMLVLDSHTDTPQLSGNIALEDFWLLSTRFTLTGLAAGDEVSFAPYTEGTHDWHIYSLTADEGAGFKSIPTLIADASGTVVLYAQCDVDEAPLRFRINGQPGTGDDQWYTFVPKPFVGGQLNYHGQHFTIACKGLGGSGMDMEEHAEKMIAEAERARFLVWADECRKITSGGIEIDFTLKHDIDLSGIGNWEPIGPDYVTAYSGTFDGGGHTISGLRVDADGSYAGLFGYLYYATVKNLTLRGATVSGTGDRTGTLAGEAYNSHLIACRVTGCQVTGNSYAGGITGDATSSTLVACHTLGGSVVSNNNSSAGGLAGYSYQSNFTACVAQPTRVKGTSDSTGALLGYASRGTLTACWWHPYKTEEDDTSTGGTDIGTNGPDYPASSTGGGKLTSATAIDAAAVTEMNAEIDAYNFTQADANRKCTYRWDITGLVPAP